MIMIEFLSIVLYQMYTCMLPEMGSRQTGQMALPLQIAWPQ
jgi:hypothetical protein